MNVSIVLPGEQTKQALAAGEVEEDLTKVMAMTMEDTGRSSTSHPHVPPQPIQVQSPPETLNLTHLCLNTVHLHIGAGSEWALIKFGVC